MKCAVHPERDAVGACVACGKPVCQECLVEVGGRNYCKACVAKNEPVPAAKSWLAALLLSIFLGVLGVDRFYLGYIGTGILKLLLFIITGIGGLIWWIIDIILIATGRMTDSQGAPLQR
jgi:hypothetical protein